MSYVTVSVPLFLLILAGYIGGRKSWLTVDAVKGLSGIAYYFALPVLLFRLMISTSLAEEFNGAFVIHYLAAGVLMFTAAAVAGRWLFNSSPAGLALTGMSAVFGNLAIIALPIVINLFGPAAILPITVLITLEAVVYMPLVIIFIEIARSDAGGGFRKAAARAFRPLISNPILLALVAGGIGSTVEFSPPPFLDSFMELVAGAAIPLALLALGATLSRRPMTERFRETAFRLALKLACYPLVMAVALSLMPGLDPVWRATAILAAAMPMGANVYLIAEAYDEGVGRASAGVLLSTAISAATVPLAAALVSRMLS